MKKYLPILFVLLFGSTLTVYAQKGDDDANFHNGIRAGWHYANVYRDGSAPYNNLNSFYIGLFSERKIAPFMRVGSSLEYFQNGYWEDKTFRMHTISLPFYLKAKIGPLFGTAGFAANFKLNDNREDFSGAPESQSKITNTKFFDLPLSAGLGLKFFIFQIEAKYSWGLFDSVIMDNPNGNSGAFKNQYFQLGLSVIL